MNKRNIKDIVLCHGIDSGGKMQHLVKLKSGKELIKTTPQMRSLGLLKVRGGRTYA